MANFKNIRVLLTIFLTAVVATAWQNCSEVGFSGDEVAASKANDDDLVANEDPVDPNPEDPGSPEDPNPEDPENPDDPSGDGSGDCNIEVADIIIDLKSANLQGSGIVLESVTGQIGLHAMVDSGLAVSPPSDVKVAASTIDLALNRGDGNFILDTAGNMHPLATLASHGKPGIKIRTSAHLKLDADGTYRLKLSEFPTLKKYKRDQCRLENNQPGTLVAQ